MFKDSLYKEKMSKTIEVFSKELSSLRTGRANANMLDLVKVDVYGQQMPINQIGSITTPEPRMINIQVWDTNNVALVDAAIKKSDLGDLKKVIKTEFNIEGYPSNDFLKMVLNIKPDQVTLVPDPPNVLTSNQGWDTVKNQIFLSSIIKTLQTEGIRTSIFIEANKEMIKAAKETNTDRIELYTELYSKNYPFNKDASIEPYIQAAQYAQDLNLGVNAGHDLDLNNLNFFQKSISNLMEVSIGHALVCDALYMGLEQTIKSYKRLLK